VARAYRPSRPPSAFARSLARARGEADGVLDELRGVILSGEAAPGMPIPLDEIAQVLGVSPIPVREALKTLIGEGLVDHRPRGGYTVARITVAELAELYVVRGVLEQAALAAALPLATAEDHAEARAAHEAVAQALAQGDMPGYHRASRRFHLALVAPARMQRLQRMLESAWNITEPYRPMSQLSDEGRAGLHADHADMLAAFEQGDSERLLTEATAHHEELRRAVESLPADPAYFAT
jgi:DNA-binding GntR family transcriptional regulator